MQLIHLPRAGSILLCFLVWPVLQIAAAVFCLYLPDRFFSPDSFWFRTRPFENGGTLYESLFHISRWKRLLPDGAALCKKRGYPKKTLRDFSPQNLQRFLVETCRGELTHWLAIFPFWVFVFFTPPGVVWIMFGYALLVNLPCIFAQRYNRPRIMHLLSRKVSQNYKK